MNTDDMRTYIIDGHKATYKEAQQIIKSKLEKDGALESFIDDNWQSMNIIGEEYKASEVATTIEGRKKILAKTTDYIIAHPEKMGITTVWNVKPKKINNFNKNNRMGNKWKLRRN